MGSTFRKGSSQSGQSGGISLTMDHIARQLHEESTPVRREGLSQIANFMHTGQLPMALTGNLATQEQELASAKRSILDNTQRGGLQQMALAELPLHRLAMRDSLRGDVFNTGLGLALGQAPTVLSGMGNAAGNLNNLGQQRIAQNMAFQQGLGSLVGQGLGAAGMAMKGCWVASAVYGPHHPRTYRLRFLFLFERPEWWLTRVYLRYGRSVGAWAERSRLLRACLRPALNLLYRRVRHGHV